MIDYAGAGLLAAALAAITLFTDLAGTSYSWTSPLILGLIAISIAAWLLVQIQRRAREAEEGTADRFALARSRDIPVDRARAAIQELEQRGLVNPRTPSENGERALEPGDARCEVLNRLVAARREHLAHLVAEWNPAGDRTLGQVLIDMARATVPDVPAYILKRG